MPSAVFAFDVDPYLRLGDRAVSFQTLGVAGAVLVMILLAALLARRAPAGQLPGPPSGRPPLSPPAWPAGPARLRLDDLLLVAVGALPGAVLGGRIGYALLHLDYYSAHPGAVLDPAQGSLQLGLALVGGTLTGAYVASLLDGRIGAWLDVAAVPVLAGLVLGKIAMALGGSGQGAPLDAASLVGGVAPGVIDTAAAGWPGRIATAYLGPGPWGSPDPSTPAWPAQLIEAALAFVALAVLMALLRSGRFGSRDGRAFLAALGLWAVARFVAAATWRDATVLGPLRADQLISLAVAVGAIALLAWLARSARRRREADAAASREGLEWPDAAGSRYL